ncbi:MAG: YihA family ribosome biogenesis GTP-binding protein, partial [Bacteroidota bacterium]
VDARLPPQKLDLAFIHWLGTHQIPFAIVLTKADKLSSKEVQQNRAKLQQALHEDWEELPPMVVTSSKDSTGREALLAYIQKVLL